MDRFHIPNEQKIANFFSQTSTSQSVCDAKAVSLAPGPIVPVANQGRHSYTVFASPSLNQIVQFRLASHFIDLDIQSLAESTYGDLVPKVSFEGELGDDDESGGRVPVCVYLMGRIPGVTRLDFMTRLKGVSLEDKLMKTNRGSAGDIARFLAQGWNSPKAITEIHRSDLKLKYLHDLQLLYAALPDRFHPVVEACIASLGAIFSLPFVLQHQNLNDANILVDAETGNLTGVLDWSDAHVLPFGMTIHSVQVFTAHLDGNPELPGHKNLETVFWEAFRKESGESDEEIIATIKKARALGALMEWGFAGKGEERRVIDVDDSKKKGGMWWLEGLLIDKATCFDHGI